MVLVLVSATEACLNIATTPDMRAADLKQALFDAYGYPVKRMRLTVNGKKLADKATVEDMVDAEQEMIVLSVGVAGGCLLCLPLCSRLCCRCC